MLIVDRSVLYISGVLGTFVFEHVFIVQHKNDYMLHM